MPRHDDTPWDRYRSLLAVVREGSLSAAARRLGLTQPTVGRHIDGLERALGRSLFTRHRSGLTATEDALALVPHAEAMEAAAAALRRTASGEPEAVTGTVRITASAVVGCEVLPGILNAFRATHPAVTLELQADDRVANLLTREADIAVRMARPTQGAVVARRVGRVDIGLFAHRDYIARHGTPTDIDALADHAVIGYDADSRAYDGLDTEGLQPTRELFDFRSDNPLAQLAAVRAGLGIGGIQVPLAGRHPELVPVLADRVRFGLDIWLAMHEDLRTVRRVRLLFDHLTASLEHYCREATAAD